jgi:hypothetical protein
MLPCPESGRAQGPAPKAFPQVLRGGGEAPDEARHSGSTELAEDLDLFVQATAGRFAKPPEQGPP